MGRTSRISVRPATDRVSKIGPSCERASGRCRSRSVYGSAGSSSTQRVLPTAMLLFLPSALHRTTPRLLTDATMQWRLQQPPRRDRQLCATRPVRTPLHGSVDAFNSASRSTGTSERGTRYVRASETEVAVSLCGCDDLAEVDGVDDYRRSRWPHSRGRSRGSGVLLAVKHDD